MDCAPTRPGARLGMRSAFGFGITLAVLALMPASALATRYVTETGSSGNNCQSIATGCDLKTAIQGNGGNVPVAGEEVIVEPGTHSIGSSDIVEGIPNLNIHGVSGQPLPVVHQTDPNAQLKFSGGTLSYLDFEGGATNIVNMSGGLMDRVLMRAASDGNFACQCPGGLIRNSVFISTGVTAALGVTSNGGTSTLEIRNVTAIATNPSAFALAAVHQTAMGSVTYNAYNVIARNTGGGTDVAALDTNSTITFHHSNYSTQMTTGNSLVQDAPGDPHQSASPLFTNAMADDFSEATGSPTIGTGLTDPLNGPLDFAGNPRSVGGLTDIGAYQVPPPPPPPGTASGPTGQRAAALKKCKKKRSKAKRRKCRKRAKRIPV
jgi:hypothetical protein